MSKHPSLLKEFRSFCYQNKTTDLEKAIEYFSVFGGMGWFVDMDKPLDELIEQKILKNYKYIHGDITTITKSNNIYHQLLSAVATGDGKEHSAFKKARLERETGEDSVDFLIDKGILISEQSVEPPFDEEEEDCDRLMFEKPFMRFWFSSVSPYYKNIKEGDYKEFYKYWNERKIGFSNFIYEKLLLELLEKSLVDDSIKTIGSYWDKIVDIDILIKTKSSKRIAGLSKFSKSKASNSDLNRLKQMCEDASLDIDMFVIFSKNKFTSELSKQKGEQLKLLSPRNLKPLLDDLDKKDLIIHEDIKKY